MAGPHVMGERENLGPEQGSAAAGASGPGPGNALLSPSVPASKVGLRCKRGLSMTWAHLEGKSDAKRG